jgi:hypothetical protein
MNKLDTSGSKVTYQEKKKSVKAALKKYYLGAPFDVCPQACSPESLPTEKQDTGYKKMELYRIKLHQRKEIHKKEQFYNNVSESS